MVDPNEHVEHKVDTLDERISGISKTVYTLEADQRQIRESLLGLARTVEKTNASIDGLRDAIRAETKTSWPAFALGWAVFSTIFSVILFGLNTSINRNEVTGAKTMELAHQANSIADLNRVALFDVKDDIYRDLDETRRELLGLAEKDKESLHIRLDDMAKWLDEVDKNGTRRLRSIERE